MFEPIRVLHVDNDPEFADLTAEFLRRENEAFSVVTVREPEAARATLAEEPIDCVVSDYEMTPVNGIEFLEAVREEHPDLPFILFTGRGSEAVASEAISAGATDYLQKETGTSQYAVLANRIENAVTRHRTRRRSRRQLRRERERFSALFEEFPEPTLAYEYVDNEPIIREVNDAFEETFGYDAERAVGTRVDDLVVPPDRMTEAKEIDERVRAGEPVDRIMLRQTADGQRYFSLRNIPLSLEEGIDGFAVFTDIHERKRREQALERKNERLEQFVSIVSHDLRNPLNVASSRLTLARDDCDSEHLEYVASAHDRIGTIIEDTLTLARQGDSVDEMGVVDLPTVARRWWESVQTADADLAIATELTIRADADRLRHVIENLYRNAVEHGSTSPRSHAPEDAVEHGSTSRQPPADDAVEHGSTSPGSQAHQDAVEHDGESVTITVGAVKGGEGNGDSEGGGDGDAPAGFFVADDGAGFPADRDDLFEPGVSTEPDGTGFGLAIVRDLAEAHGWDVTATESETGGARVEITGVNVVE
jgi:PAS domain S-box-containing protein